MVGKHMSDVDPSFLIFLGAESEFVSKKNNSKQKRTKLPPLNLSGIKFEDASRIAFVIYIALRHFNGQNSKLDVGT